MKKILNTINADYIDNAYAKDIISKYLSEGWGIDAMVEDSRRRTWITFYRYATETKDQQEGIERLKKKATTWLLKESIAKENKENAQRQIEKLESQIEELELKTAEA